MLLDVDRVGDDDHHGDMLEHRVPGDFLRQPRRAVEVRDLVLLLVEGRRVSHVAKQYVRPVR